MPWLVRYFSSNSFLRSLAGEAILICFIATAFLHKSNNSAVFFLDRHHFTQYLSRQIFFFTLPLLKFAQNTLLFIPMEAPSHLASSLRRNFGARTARTRTQPIECQKGSGWKVFSPREEKKIVQSIFCSYVRFLEKFALSFFLISLNQSKDGSNSLLALIVYLLQIKIISSFRKKFKLTMSFEWGHLLANLLFTTSSDH